MRNAILAIALVLIVSASTPGQQGTGAPEPTVKLPPELARVLTDYESAWRSRDAAALARLFAEDGFVLPNGAPPVRRRELIQKYYTGAGRWHFAPLRLLLKGLSAISSAGLHARKVKLTSGNSL